MLDISSVGRPHFTAHGFHLRASGKRALAKPIVETVVPLIPDHQQPNCNLSATDSHSDDATNIDIGPLYLVLRVICRGSHRLHFANYKLKFF